MRYRLALPRPLVDARSLLIAADYKAALRALDREDDHAEARWEGEGGNCPAVGRAWVR